MSIDAPGGGTVLPSVADPAPVSTASTCAASLVYRSEYRYYDFGPEQPLRPERLIGAQSLLAAAGLWPTQDELIWAPPASPDELWLTHSEQYVEAVKRIDLFASDPEFIREAEPWGLGPGDSPAFVGMHTSAALIAGGTVQPVRSVVSGQVSHVFHPAGGLHHAMPQRASGFCIYNDAGIAIKAALGEQVLRVLYVDFDAHHGDGVQAAFYG